MIDSSGGACLLCQLAPATDSLPMDGQMDLQMALSGRRLFEYLLINLKSNNQKKNISRKNTTTKE